MDPSQLTAQVLVALRRIIRATDLYSRQLLREHGLTAPQLVVLQQVAAHRELSGSSLARTASLSLATTSGVVARLESRGLVARRRGASDRRQMLVSITDAGRRALESAPPPLQETLSRQLQALPEWEQSLMLSVLQRIVSMMEAEETPLLDGPEPGETRHEGVPEGARATAQEVTGAGDPLTADTGSS